MQKLTAILRTGTSGVKFSDEYGGGKNKTLELVLGTAVELTFDLRSEEISPETAELLPLDGSIFNGCRSFFFAVDRDYDRSTEPLLLRTSGIESSVNEQGTFLKVFVENTAVKALSDALGRNMSADFICELAGLDENGTANFSWLFPVTFRNRIFMGGDDVPESVVSDPAYLTSAEVRALVDSGLAETVAAEVRNHLPAIGENGNWFINGTDSGKPARGESGKTPTRGTDYWTAEDIAGIKSYVDEAILNGSW